MKTCYRCGVEKDEAEFYKNNEHKDGLSSYCRSCEKFCNTVRRRINESVYPTSVFPLSRGSSVRKSAALRKRAKYGEAVSEIAEPSRDADVDDVIRGFVSEHYEE